MVNQSTERHKLRLPTPRTFITLLAMHRARQMLVQRCQIAETTLAEVASVTRAIPGRTGGVTARPIVRRGRGVPADLFRGEVVVRVDLAAIIVDFLAVDAGAAGPGFEVQADAGEVGELRGTPGAFDIFPHVDRGFEMLRPPLLFSYLLLERLHCN